MIDVNNFEYMKIGLASPNKIRSWSRGEVKKPETINYRTLKPEKDGLFCERIFGPQKDWECHCGKYKRVRYKGVVCDRCGVEVTRAKVRRERMGHIELAAPVSHIWYFKGIPSRMGLVLDMSPRSLEEVIYFASYVVTDPGDTPLEKKQLLSEKEFRAYLDKYGRSFTAQMGAEAIRKLLMDIDLDKEVDGLKEELQTAQGQRRTRAIKRLEVLEAFRNSGNEPSWMILDVLPVIPPELRPMVQLDGGRFATSDLNDLYRRVINRNNRLKRLLDLGAPSIIVQNEKRMLQEAVDALIDNGRRGRPVTGPGNRPLKSLSHMLKGKQGRFRQNLLGKRVDYSGRSVIVVGPNLKMYQCGLPKEMALELFKPFVMKELVSKGLAHNIKSAKRKVERVQPEVWDVLEEVIKEHPVLLNRAPTLHRLGIQAFEPTLVEGRAIKLHPLVCTAYNADFDGDQMAVHVPLSAEAQAEARILMLAAQNILNPKDGKPVVTPSQDMVLGNYYLTMEREGAKGEGSVFKDTNEALIAYQNGYVHLHTRIAIPVASLGKTTFKEEQNSQLLLTTVGKLIFNEILPESFPYVNEPTAHNLEVETPSKYMVPTSTNVKELFQERDVVAPFKKGFLGNIIAEVFKKFKITETSKMLDRMKDLGFKYSTKAGITVGVADIVVLPEKKEILAEAEKKVDRVLKQFRRGLITEEERYDRVISIWSEAKDVIQDKLMGSLDKRNPIFMMSDSGARGNASNFTQLAGMRGLMANPSGRIIELPIKSSFREGLTVLEYFISTHGARKGLADTALKTADSGYLTRRLVDVAQDVIVREDDCGTDRGLEVEAIKEGNEIIEGLYDRLVGRVAFKTVRHPETGEPIVKKNELIHEDLAKQIVEAGVEQVTIRSVFTCDTRHGVCKKCYGRNLATGSDVEVGEAVGIIAAQSIGEPGTQLTMRTFHTGGVAGDDITQGLPRIQELFEARNPKGQAVITEIEGEVTNINEADKREITVKGEMETKTYSIPYGARIKVELGEQVVPGQSLTEGSIDPKELLKVQGMTGVQEYLLREVQKVYRMQGVEIGDKHVEVMVRQMLRKIRVIDAGDTEVLPGSLIEIQHFNDENKKVLLSGKRPATGRPVLLGITKASLETDSFLSAASFQETTRVLTDAAIKGKRDELVGLKENVIIGKLVPAGTGMNRYRNLDIVSDYDQQAVGTEEAVMEEAVTTE
ncbi:DNA-directed RNA polymerase subunit beta' [Halalkalibacterium halodurans]|uniref:DNA-directed RNA polymerase subunit beta' n=1 Tax=Halalkalibacterium halodurans (strain ATCC BAA-125 / DSM 18197 / FERM 7344 / JCM 9153 / C-125) TaxID=272558 RepID=RPOC_HALH5|nr:DNA-directed RNA polymerase subunit beta' [Halalkalibacterium halodurans]Q9Z9M1.1 RecName: Full=DNA-directed RNA polymerase subunit beta'; Short=RNAP subunit beta'; AltName: Full=RNA polymerase subunit beta'; AltName: Full=Transcriptase subunit beta' [Halalkalibacterium halodurans C-125]MED4123721.1 DNA-directed RNA polymerase subunit beta' [Halalkalibacterium halodurans]BAA75264.1 rpoC [Halalkalibacterium halodurans]BAB03846.1 DNA-directed RNA polymerase beta' subunit [Halalkalibacterium ha